MRNILILKFPYSSLYGGGEHHTIQLVEGLQKKDFSFFLVSSCSVLLKEFKKRHWSAKKTWAGIEPVSKGALLLWPFLAPIVSIKFFFILLHYRLVKKVKVVYCLSLTEKLLATLPARMLGYKVVWVEHVTIERWLSKNPLKVFYKMFSKFVKVVGISKVVAKQLIEDIGVPKKNVQVIYNGVDVDKFKMREYRWTDSARYNIGCIARVEKEKGIEFLIQAVKIVKEFIPFIRLIIVGDGREKKKLFWLSERLGLLESVQWVGHQKEIEKWYGYFDAYVLPSVIRESFGITLIEAMASGVPVIASKIGGTPEIIDHQKTGLLAEPKKSGDIADQLIYLFNNREKTRQMVIDARKKVATQFGLDRMLRDYYLLLRK